MTESPMSLDVDKYTSPDPKTQSITYKIINTKALYMYVFLPWEVSVTDWNKVPSYISLAWDHAP